MPLQPPMKMITYGKLWFGWLMALALTGVGAEVHFTEQGLVLDGGAAGSFCLKYPALLDDAQKPIQPASVTVQGTTASVSFDYMLATSMPSGSGGEAWFTLKAWSGGLDQEPPSPKPDPAKTAPPKPAPAGPKFALRLTQEGLAIDAGSDGQFTLAYPVFVGARWDDVRKPVEHKVTGNTATLRFDGDLRLEVALQPAEGTLTLTPVNVPASVKSLRGTMLID